MSVDIFSLVYTSCKRVKSVGRTAPTRLFSIEMPSYSVRGFENLVSACYCCCYDLRDVSIYSSYTFASTTFCLATRCIPSSYISLSRARAPADCLTYYFY